MRQPILFLIIGGVQYVLDAFLFGFFMSLTIPLVSANVFSRVSASVLGFGLNRYITFQHRNDNWHLMGISLVRYITLFIALTLISTLSISAMEQTWGDEIRQMVAYKVLIEAVLACISFLLSKYWVFRS